MPASYEDLIVWQKSMDLVTQIYALFDNMPNIEKYALIDQMRRSAVSIPSNIAEGQGRGSDKDFLKFLYIARGSIYELQTQLELCVRLNYFNDDYVATVKTLITEVSKMVNVFIIKLQENVNSSN